MANERRLVEFVGTISEEDLQKIPEEFIGMIKSSALVRCKDCIHSRELDRSDSMENLYVKDCLWCEFYGTAKFPDEYCSDGERRCE